MPRYAIVTVVEADFAEVAWEAVADRLGALPKPSDGSMAVFVGDALQVAELDEYDTRSLVAAIATHPDLPGGRGYTIHHVAGEGFWLGIGGAEYGPYDCKEDEAIGRAFHDAAAGAYRESQGG